MWCGRNTANAQHHIVGRGTPNSFVEQSLYNCAWVCNQSCHINVHGQLRTEENERMLLQKTKSFLDKNQYKPNETDRNFLEKYSKYYQ